MLRPIGARAVIQRIKDTNSKIIIPESNILRGDVYVPAVVLAVGDGAYLENGEKVPVSVKPGDKVLVPERVGYHVRQGDQEYIIINERDIIAVLEE